MDEIMKVFKLTEEQVLQAEQSWVKTDKFQFNVKFNQKRKYNTQVLATMYFKNIE
jgi:hypothetical protein